MARISAARRKEVRALLLASGARQFAEHGLGGANINAISVEAGFAKGTVYNYFSSKEELFSEVLRDASSQTIERYRAREEPVDLRGRLLALAEEDVALVAEHPDFAKTFCRELMAPTESTRAHVLAGVAPLGELVAEWMGEAQAAGELRSDLDALRLASSFLGSLTMGYAQHWLSEGAWPTLEELPALAVTLFLDGAVSSGSSEGR